MTEERPKEVQDFFDEIKHFIMKVVPDTFSGYLLLLIINVGILKINSTEFMVGVAKTGIYVFVLVLARYLAIACRMLINHGISSFNKEVGTK